MWQTMKMTSKIKLVSVYMVHILSTVNAYFAYIFRDFYNAYNEESITNSFTNWSYWNKPIASIFTLILPKRNHFKYHSSLSFHMKKNA